MEKLNINPPKGYEIDQDKSNLDKGEIYFKEVKKQLTYEDVAEELFFREHCYHLDEDSLITYDYNYDMHQSLEVDNSVTKAQLESILSLNKLCNVAKYLNDDWKSKRDETKYFIQIIHKLGEGEVLNVNVHETVMRSNVYFKSQALAYKAIKILGEEDIRKALTLNH